MPRTSYYLIAAVFGATGIGAYVLTNGPTPVASAIATVPEAAEVVVAAGRVEPRSEEIVLSAEIGGRIARIAVEEGDRVVSGQVVAELDSEVYAARAAAAEALVRQKAAELRRIQSGARNQERAAAFAVVKEARTVLANAEAEFTRRRALAEKGHISAEELQRAERAVGVAKAKLDAARSQHALIVDPARDEDLVIAQAELAAAEAHLAEAQALLAQTLIRSPIGGVVLRRHRRVGEVVSELRDTAILSVGDVSTLYVRADLDETDIGKVAIGSPVEVRADAFGQTRFRGRVVRIGQELGRKRYPSEKPGERLDTRVLEVLIELDGVTGLLPGLRVDAYFQLSGTRNTAVGLHS